MRNEWIMAKYEIEYLINDNVLHCAQLTKKAYMMVRKMKTYQLNNYLKKKNIF